MKNRFLLISLSSATLMFELPITSVARALGHLGPNWAYTLSYLIHPAILFAATLLASGDYSRPLGRNRHAVILLLMVYGVGLLVSGLENSADFRYFLPLFFLGPVLMSIIIITVRTQEMMTDVVTAVFYAGCVWSVVFLFLFAWDWSVFFERYQYIKLQGFLAILQSSKYPGENIDYSGTYFYRYLGNSNKQSNIIFLTCIIGSYLVARGRLGGIKFFTFCLPMVLIMAILGSRAVILLGAIVAVILAITHVRSLRSKTIWLLTPLLPLAISLANPTLKARWLDTSSLVERTAIADAALEGGGREILGGGLPIHPVADADHSLLFGYGAGKFGPTIGRLPEAGSHIFFMDVWIEAGLIGLLAMLIIFFGLSLRSFLILLRTRLEDQNALFSCVGISVVLALGMREYSLVYLFTQSISAVLPTLFFVLALDKLEGP
jgi:hypothetical protein